MNFLDDRLPMRFWDQCIPEPNSGCWLWFGNASALGYGRMSVNSRSWFTHRLSWTAANGNIPAGLVVDHLCRTPACCNPLHLEPVTQGVNVMRGIGPIAANQNKLCCPAGHPYEGANLYRHTEGDRRCRECHRLAEKARRARLKAARVATHGDE